MDALKLVLRLFCLLPLVTGANDVAQGIRALGPAGAVIPDRVAADPVLNSQFKFFGAVWFGWGLTLCRASADPRADAGLLRLLIRPRSSSVTRVACPRAPWCWNSSARPSCCSGTASRFVGTIDADRSGCRRRTAQSAFWSALENLGGSGVRCKRSRLRRTPSRPPPN